MKMVFKLAFLAMIFSCYAWPMDLEQAMKVPFGDSWRTPELDQLEKDNKIIFTIWSNRVDRYCQELAKRKITVGRDDLSYSYIGETPTCWADTNQLDLLEEYLQAGGNPDSVRSNEHAGLEGLTPLSRALYRGNIQAIKLLLSYGARVDKKIKTICGFSDHFNHFAACCLMPMERNCKRGSDDEIKIDEEKRDQVVEIFELMCSKAQNYENKSYLALLSKRLEKFYSKDQLLFRKTFKRAHELENHPLIGQLPLELLGEIEKEL